MKLKLFILILFSAVLGYGQGISPRQLESSPYENGILKGVVKYYDEWAADTLYYFQHDTLISYVDSVYITSDSILCFRIDQTIICDTIRVAGGGGAIDYQELSIDSTGRVFTITLTNGGDVSFLDTNSDEQKIDTFELYDTNKIRISLESDGENYKTLTLPEQDSSLWVLSVDTLYNKNIGDLVKVKGTLQVTDLETGNSRTLIGEIGDGTFQSVTIGTGLDLNSTTNTLSSTAIDSTVVRAGYGLNTVESPANNWLTDVDTTIIATVWDIEQINFIDSTALTEGYGINVSETDNDWTIEADTTQLATQYDLTLLEAATAWDSLYNGNRAISRVPTVGSNLGATTFRQWLDWWYIANYQAPTISLGSLTTPREVGTSNNYTLSGSTTNPCSFTLSNGTVNGNNFGSNTSYSYSYTHEPTSAGTTTITASQAWDETGSICADGSPNTGTASASRTIYNVYPFFYGMSATEYTSGSVPYTEFTKKVETEGNKTGLTMTGTNMYIYIILPKSWGDYTLSKIYDHNNFDVTGSFTAYDVSITSTGLTNDWTYNYKIYKLNNLTTASGYNYRFER